MRSIAPLLAGIAVLMALGFAGGLGLPRVDHPATLDTVQREVRPPCTAPAKLMTRLELLFGATRPGGTTVGEAEWLAFVDGEVTPRFPAGLTMLSGLGQWRNAHGRISRETSRILLIWHVPAEGTETGIAAIREEYKRRFGQDSVMRVDGQGCVSF